MRGCATPIAYWLSEWRVTDDRIALRTFTQPCSQHEWVRESGVQHGFLVPRAPLPLPPSFVVRQFADIHSLFPTFLSLAPPPSLPFQAPSKPMPGPDLALADGRTDIPVAWRATNRRNRWTRGRRKRGRGGGALERIHSKPDSRVNKETTVSKRSPNINVSQRWTETTRTASSLNLPLTWLWSSEDHTALARPRVCMLCARQEIAGRKRAEEKRGRANEQVSVGQSKEGEKRKKEKGG